MNDNITTSEISNYGWTAAYIAETTL